MVQGADFRAWLEDSGAQPGDFIALKRQDERVLLRRIKAADMRLVELPPTRPAAATDAAGGARAARAVAATAADADGGAGADGAVAATAANAAAAAAAGTPSVAAAAAAAVPLIASVTVKQELVERELQQPAQQPVLLPPHQPAGQLPQLSELFCIISLVL